jgi:hypothetical protein
MSDFCITAELFKPKETVRMAKTNTTVAFGVLGARAHQVRAISLQDACS